MPRSPVKPQTKNTSGKGGKANAMASVGKKPESHTDNTTNPGEHTSRPALLSLGTIMVQNQILQMIAQADPADQILDTMTQIIEQHSSPAICIIFLLDSKTQTLHCGAAPSFPREYIDYFDGMKIGPKVGSCGTAAFKNTTIIIEDIENDPLWSKHKQQPLALGLKACWSVPIQDRKGNPQGTICLFYPECRLPSDEEHEILFNSARLVGIALDHHKAEEELKNSRETFKELVEERTMELTEAIRQLQDEIVQRKQIENSLKESNEQLQTLSSHLQTVREEERANISREIHDELGQILTTLKMEISLLKDKGQEESLPIEEDLDSMTSLVETTLNTVRRISSELRPGILDVLGLVEALEWQVQEFQNRTHIRIQSKIERIPVPEKTEFATACFRLCQEALTNVARHANATRVTVTFRQHKGNLELSIQDNGRGITKHQISNITSLGLLGMRERVQNLGGTLSISGTAKKGTTVMASFPLD